jgi:murein DD-endopeptidase MepM/ murein hydrolase activator NlpD
MAAGTVGYTDTRSFSGSLLGDIAKSIGNRTKKAALMAREERAFAEEQAEKQDTSLDEAGIGKGYFFRRALGSTFGGDRIARTRGYFEKDPPMGRDPLGSIESRFRGGFDYGLDQEELKKSVKSGSSSYGPSSRSRGTKTGGTSPLSGSGDKDKPISVKHTRLTVGMLSTFQRLEKQLANVTDMIGGGSKSPQTVYALENQKMLLGSVFAKTTNIINSLNKAINGQTSEIKKIANAESNKAKQAAIDAASKSEELQSEQQDGSFGTKFANKLKQARERANALTAPGSRLKDIIGPSSQIRRSLMRNPRAAMRLARMRAKRVLGKTITRGVGRPLNKVGRIIANKTLKKAVAKSAAKGLGKSLIKKVPILGAVAGVAFGIERAMKGDWVGAVGEVASGVAGSFPGVGTAISTGIDAALVAKDVHQEMKDTPSFETGGIFVGEENIKSTLTKFENEKLKREVGAKPLDMNFWRNWHAFDIKFDMKNKKTLQKFTQEGLADYFYKQNGVKEFVDGIKWIFKKIVSLIPAPVRGTLNWFRDRGADLTSGLRSLFGGGSYRGPQMSATGGAKVTQANISRGFGVRDDLGSGKNPGGHTGLDIAGGGFTQGTPISFLPPGKVIDVGIMGDENDPGGPNGNNAGYGNFVVIKTDTGEIVKMAHFDSVSVSKGQRVGKKDDGTAVVVGKLGNTGLSTGPHLHLDLGTGYNPSSAYVSGLMDPMPFVNDLIRGGGDVKVTGETAAPRSAAPASRADLGAQKSMATKDFGALSDEGKTGYLIIPGHASGGGAPGEKELVKLLAKNAYENIKKKNPNLNVQMMDLDSKFADTDDGWEKQKEWYKSMEAKGWEILEIHMDSDAAKGGTGVGVIVPHRELNAVEKDFAQRHGAYPRDWRSKPGETPLAAPSRGVSMFELGNMSPELQGLVKSGNITKAQLDLLTRGFEYSVQSGMGAAPQITVPALNTNKPAPSTTEAATNFFLKGL